MDAKTSCNPAAQWAVAAELRASQTRKAYNGLLIKLLVCPCVCVCGLDPLSRRMGAKSTCADSPVRCGPHGSGAGLQFDGQSGEWGPSKDT